MWYTCLSLLHNHCIQYTTRGSETAVKFGNSEQSAIVLWKQRCAIVKMKSFQPKTSYTVFAEQISDRIPTNVKKATSGAVRVWNEWSDERTSLPTRSR